MLSKLCSILQLGYIIRLCAEGCNAAIYQRVYTNAAESLFLLKSLHLQEASAHNLKTRAPIAFCCILSAVGQELHSLPGHHLQTNRLLSGSVKSSVLKCGQSKDWKFPCSSSSCSGLCLTQLREIKVSFVGLSSPSSSSLFMMACFLFCSEIWMWGGEAAACSFSWQPTCQNVT